MGPALAVRQARYVDAPPLAREAAVGTLGLLGLVGYGATLGIHLSNLHNGLLALHPRGSDRGDKTEQLHSMLVDPLWYPAHLVGLLGFACVAAGLVALRSDPVLRDRLGRLLSLSVVVAVIHLLAATQAEEIEDGTTTPLVTAFTGVETLVNPAWD